LQNKGREINLAIGENGKAGLESKQSRFLLQPCLVENNDPFSRFAEGGLLGGEISRRD
jgi:hypothetical protein